MTYTEKQLKFLSAAIVKYGEGAVLAKKTITEIAEENGLKFPFWLTDARRMGAFTKVSSALVKFCFVFVWFFVLGYKN